MVHLVRIPTGHLPREVFQARAVRACIGEDPGLCGEIISQHWPGNASGSVLANVAGEREVLGPLLELLPSQPDHR